MFRKVDSGGFFFWGLWDLVEDNSEEKPFVAILSRSIHIMPGLYWHCPTESPDFHLNVSCLVLRVAPPVSQWDRKLPYNL